nr:hypothetical protein [Citrobacter freundii]
MTKLTKEHLEEIAELARKATYKPCAMHMTNLLVVCDSEVIEGMARQLLAGLEQEPMAWVTMQKEFCDDERTAITNRVDADRYSISCYDLTPLYAAPQLPQPAVLSVPAAMEMDDDFDSAFEHGKAVGWNAYRAAMLQAEPASNSDELPPDYLQGHKDGLEWAAQLAEANHPQTGDWLYDDPIELARAIRKGPDMPTVQDGNSPVTPDCWCRICRPVTMSDMRFVVCPECGNKRCPHANDHNNACTGSNEPGQVGSAYPAAPQQEVKSSLEHGMQRYAGAMQKLSEGDD